jgi:hypothetical protein
MLTPTNSFIKKCRFFYFGPKNSLFTYIAAYFFLFSQNMHELLFSRRGFGERLKGTLQRDLFRVFGICSLTLCQVLY